MSDYCGHGMDLCSVCSPAVIEALRQALRDHYLAGIECDHERKRDRASCSCSRVTLPWRRTVGDAVESWARHVEEIAGFNLASKEPRP